MPHILGSGILIKACRTFLVSSGGQYWPGEIPSVAPYRIIPTTVNVKPKTVNLRPLDLQSDSCVIYSALSNSGP